MTKYNGKYSLTENLVNGRGMRLLNENIARQEQALDRIGTTDGKLVASNGVTIDGIIGSTPGMGQMKINGKASITDVQFQTASGNVNISCKGQQTPGSASGNKNILIRMIGLDVLNKAAAAFSNMIKSRGYKKGDRVSGFQALVEIPQAAVGGLLAGTEAEGGPIHYFYKGPMDVIQDETGAVNGTLETPQQYAAGSGKFYLLLRQKANNQIFLDDLTDKDGSGVSKVLGLSQGQKIAYNGFRIDVKSEADASANLKKNIIKI